LIPFISATESPWFLKLFKEEAKVRHAHSRWDPATRQVFSAEEAELEDLLADDDAMNKSDEPTLIRPANPFKVNIPDLLTMETDPTLYKDDDSVSTFQPQTTPLQPSLSFNPRVVPTSGIPIPVQKQSITIDINEDHNENMSKISDAESRLSSIEEKFEVFQSSLQEMKLQASIEAAHNAKTLDHTLSLLSKAKIIPIANEQPAPSELASLLTQMTIAGGTYGTAGHGC
jgi:hypothetical protein